MTTTQQDLNTRHEAQVDEKLADIWGETSKIEQKLQSNRASLGFKLGHRYSRDTARISDETLRTQTAEKLADDDLAPWTRREIEENISARDELLGQHDELREQARPYEAEFNAARWSRFFIVQNNGGHIHSSMNCSTCNRSTSEPTRFGWLPELSGLTEKDAVDAYGAILCTVCFPSAPVEWTNAHELAAEAKKAEKAKTQCPGSGTHDHDSSGLRYYSPRARCNHCGQTTSVTSTGKLRSHKPKAAK